MAKSLDVLRNAESEAIFPTSCSLLLAVVLFYSFLFVYALDLSLDLPPFFCGTLDQHLQFGAFDA